MPAAPPLLPPAPRWIRNLCGGLLALYVAELVARTAGLPVDLLAWFPLRGGFAPWQPLTRFLVQGGDPGTVLRVVIGLAAIWFGLPQLDRGLVARAAVAAAVGGTVVAFALDALGILGPFADLGWTTPLFGTFVLYGLLRPDAQILAYFVLPVTGRALVWGALGIAALMFLAQRSLGTADALGAWLGVWLWFRTLGPGGHKRRLRARGRAIEKELSRFQVIEGGNRAPSRDDPWVN